MNKATAQAIAAALDVPPARTDARLNSPERETFYYLHLDPARGCSQLIGPVITRRVPPRDKCIRYDAGLLPKIDPAKEYSASDIVTGAMKVFARDSRVVSIDSDLATTSGLEAGVASVDQRRALNAGVAEANMMALGEAFAALGYNSWTSTFCPFWDWKVMRAASPWATRSVWSPWNQRAAG